MATVTGTLQKPNQAAYTGKVTFRLQSPPLDDDPLLTAGGDVQAQCNGSGIFAITLAWGIYEVLIPDTRHFLISVPDNANTYDIRALISDALPYTPSVPPAVAVDRGFRAWADLAAMRAEVSIASLRVGVLFGDTSLGEPVLRIYRYVHADVSAESLPLIVTPTDAGGRWFSGL